MIPRGQAILSAVVAIAHEAVGPLAIVVLGETDPDDTGWHALVEWLASRPELRVLLVSHGGAPSAKQRQLLVDRALKTRPSRTVVLTESAAVRGAAAAMSWFLEAPIECFAPDERERARAHLEVVDAPWALEALAQLEAKVGSSTTRPPAPPMSES